MNKLVLILAVLLSSMLLSCSDSSTEYFVDTGKTRASTPDGRDYVSGDVVFLCLKPTGKDLNNNNYWPCRSLIEEAVSSEKYRLHVDSPLCKDGIPSMDVTAVYGQIFTNKQCSAMNKK